MEVADIVLHPAIRLEDPYGSADFVALQASAACVLTDSGTVQEECSLLHVPIVTCRDTTDRPEPIESGSNVLCGVEDPQRMLSCVDMVLGRPCKWESPYAQDRHVIHRVMTYLLNGLSATATPRRGQPAGA